MSLPNGYNLNCDAILVGGNRDNKSQDFINISHFDPTKEIHINGLLPGSGGGIPTDPSFNTVTITGTGVGELSSLVCAGEIEAGIGLTVVDGDLEVLAGEISAITSDVSGLSTVGNLVVNNVADVANTHIKCPSYEFRQTGELDGWNINQFAPSVPPTSLDNALLFSPGNSSSTIGVLSSDFDPNVNDVPAIIISAQTEATLGLVQCNGVVKCPKIAFGLEASDTAHWTAEEALIGDPENDNLVLTAPGASSVFKIKDNSGNTSLQQSNLQTSLNTNTVLSATSDLTVTGITPSPSLRTFMTPVVYTRTANMSFFVENGGVGADNLIGQFTPTGGNLDWTPYGGGTAIALPYACYRCDCQQTTNTTNEQNWAFSFVFPFNIVAQDSNNLPDIDYPTSFNFLQTTTTGIIVRGRHNDGLNYINLFYQFKTSVPNPLETGIIKYTMTKLFDYD